MTTYLRPGVFIEETLKPLVDPAQASSDAIAAFVGTTRKGGPVGPTLITSWTQYRSLFGDIHSDGDDLGYGVFTFFNNGGSQCYICRAVNSGATDASVTLSDADTTPETALTVTATSPGKWADGVLNPQTGVFITVSAEDGGRFDFIVEVGQGTNLVAREQFADLTLDPQDPRYAVTLINSPTVGSKYVTVAAPTTGVFGTDFYNPAAVAATPLIGGSDGTGSPDLVAATQTLDDIDQNLMVNLPGVSSTTTLSDVINWAETKGNVFVVVDGAKPAPTDKAADVANALSTLRTGLPASTYAAVYGPWLYINDPASRVSGALRLTAPGGSVLGQYARNDVVRGVQKAPAGTGTALRGVVDVAVRFDNTSLDTLNQKNVNVIRSVPGAGFCIMGARSLKVGYPDRYINIRRALMYLKRDLVNITRFAIFEVNDDRTWENIAAVISQYLTTQFQVGLLSGTKIEEAFYVICDETNNDPASVNVGIVNVEVGVALNSPAEFIIIRIGQFDGASTVTDDAS